MPARTADTSAARYALDHGLTVNHLTLEAPFVGNSSMYSENILSYFDDCSAVTEDHACPVIDFLPDPAIVAPTERLHASRDAIDLIYQAASLSREPCPTIPVKSVRSRSHLAALRLELPLLRSDHDYDVRALLRLCHDRRIPDLTADILPPERLDISRDEALQFPQTADKLRQHLAASSNHERLDIGREVVEYLARVLSYDGQDMDTSSAKIVRLSYIQERTITPPLMPLTPPVEPFIPDSEVCQVPLTSDPATLIEVDSLRAETKLLDVDKPLEQTSAEDVSRYLASSPSPTTGNVLKYKSLEDIRVESPVIPYSKLPEATFFAKTLQEHANDFTSISRPGRTLDKFDESVLPEEVLTTQGKQVVDCLLRTLQQERLDAADAIARIPIPTMDFKIGAPEWQRHQHDVSAYFQKLRQNMGRAFTPPYLFRQAPSAGSLRWVPFSSENGKTMIWDSIDEIADLAKLLEDYAQMTVATSKEWACYEFGSVNCSSRRTGDDEIYSSLHMRKSGTDKHSNTISNLDDLLREQKKRRLEDDVHLETQRTYKNTAQKRAVTTNNPIVPKDHVGTNTIPAPRSMLPDSTSVSATASLLENFMDIRAHKTRQPSSSKFFSVVKPHSRNSDVANKSKDRSAAPEDESGAVGSARIEESSAYFPVTNGILPSATIIKSLTLERTIFSKLEAEYPSLSVIERDFSRWNTVNWDKGAITRSPKTSILAAEADLIISPATGMILTNLIKVMQRGSATHQSPSTAYQTTTGSISNSLRARIADVAPRYERLIVLVSENNRFDETPRNLSVEELRDLAEFSGFASGLGSHVQVVYVGGGIAILVKWIVAMIAQFTMPSMHNMVMQDESAWELFLRRAGMNAYAAQVVPGLVSVSPQAERFVTPAESLSLDVGQDCSARLPGLLLFMKITPHERVQCLRENLGGVRILHHVNEVLEAQWG